MIVFYDHYQRSATPWCSPLLLSMRMRIKSNSVSIHEGKGSQWVQFLQSSAYEYFSLSGMKYKCTIFIIFICSVLSERQWKLISWLAEMYISCMFLAFWGIGAERFSDLRVVLHPSSVFRLLQNHSINFDETCYRWRTQGPLQVLLLLFLFFGQIRPGRGQNRSRGPLLKKNFYFRPEGYSNKTNA